MKQVTLACALAFMAGCASAPSTRAPGKALYVAVAVVGTDKDAVIGIDAIGAEDTQAKCDKELADTLAATEIPAGKRVDAACVKIPLSYVPTHPQAERKVKPAPGEQDL